MKRLAPPPPPMSRFVLQVPRTLAPEPISEEERALEVSIEGGRGRGLGVPFVRLSRFCGSQSPPQRAYLLTLCFDTPIRSLDVRI